METIAILTAGTVTDPYSGEAVEDWNTPTEVNTTLTAPPEPRPSTEPVQDARNSVTSGWTLYLPAGTAITAKNRVRVRGVVYPVRGEPAVWPKGVVIQAYGTAG